MNLTVPQTALRNSGIGRLQVLTLKLQCSRIHLVFMNFKPLYQWYNFQHLQDGMATPKDLSLPNVNIYMYILA